MSGGGDLSIYELGLHDSKVNAFIQQKKGIQSFRENE